MVFLLNDNSSRTRRGFTLLELVVVLTILTVLGGIVLAAMSGRFTVRSGNKDWTAQEAVTWTNLQTLREAIVGSGLNAPGYLEDVGAMPTTVGDLLRQPIGVPNFNPAYRRGWRGPYLQPTGARYDSAFGPDYGDADDPAVLDAWGNPIILQIPITAPESARLVSAGADGILDTNDDLDGTNRGDDLVLFLLREDTLP